MSEAWVPIIVSHITNSCLDALFSGGVYTLVSGKNGESRSSLSVDSIDSRTCPTPETHRRSKSILKKHESSGSACANHKGRMCDDPEMEKLISDTGSGASGSDYSPGKSPPALRAIGLTTAPLCIDSNKKKSVKYNKTIFNIKSNKIVCKDLYS